MNLVDRLGDKPHGPDASAVLAGFLGRYDTNRDVPGGQVVLEAGQDVPAVDVGQQDVQREGTGVVLPCQRERAVPSEVTMPL